MYLSNVFVVNTLSMAVVGGGQIFEGYLKQKFGGKTDTRQSQYILRFYLIPPSLARTDSKDTLTGLVVACLTAA